MNDRNENLAVDWELLETRAPRTKDRRIYQLLPRIEAALAAGVSHGAILEQIRRSGLEMTFKHYENSLARARARARAQRAKVEIEATRKPRSVNKQQFSAPLEREAHGGAARISASAPGQSSGGRISDLALALRPTEKPQLDRLWGAPDPEPDQEERSSSTDNPHTKE